MIDNVKEAEIAHNALANSDEEYGKMSAYVKMAPFYLKLLKSKKYLDSVGTIAERDAHAYSSPEYMEYVDGLDATTVQLEILEAKRESWQREVEIWRTLSANQRR